MWQNDLAETLSREQAFIVRSELADRKLDAIELTENVEAFGMSASPWMKKFIHNRKTTHSKHGVKLEFRSDAARKVCFS